MRDLTRAWRSRGSAACKAQTMMLRTATDQFPGWSEGLSVWPSPAKLNLFLHITGRRDDGYHLLQTVFQLLDVGDQLAFESRSDSVIRLVDQIESVAEKENLVWRAANVLAQSAPSLQKNLGVDIYLKKILPMGGGLGGGSSNAATTLVALNKVWQLQYPIEKLAEIGLSLGADVPVFVRGLSSWAEGVGEKLQALTLPESWFVVIHPGVHISTEKLFGHSELTRDCTPITIRGFCDGRATRNVFEPLACKQQASVRVALARLAEARHSYSSESGNAPRLTGTGSCVFMACETESEARNVLSAVMETEENSMSGFVAKGINESPLVRMR